MTGEKLMDAISHISNRYIVEYSVIKPVTKDPIDYAIRKKHVLMMCACLVLVIVGVALATNFFMQKKELQVGTLVAYATVEGGESADVELSKADDSIPLSLVRASNGNEGFLLSIVVGGDALEKKINVIENGQIDQADISNFQIDGVQYEKGRIYYFITCEVGEISFFGVDDKEGFRYDVTINIIEHEGSYYAKLQALTCYPSIDNQPIKEEEN